MTTLNPVMDLKSQKLNAAASLATAIAKARAPDGVFAAMLTPIAANGDPDLPALVDHGRWLLANGCDGLAPLGTTGEANSLSLRQRLTLIEGAVAGGLPAERMIPGTGACAIAEAVELTRAAVRAGCGGVLMLPPFYYKNPTEDGLFAFFARVIEQVADSSLRLYLYHFPRMSSVPLPPSLIERLVASFPGIVAGLKDSSGEWSYSEDLLKRLPGFRVYSGSEVLLLTNLRAGGAGCISATTNFTAPLAGAVRARHGLGEADAVQHELSELRRALEEFPVIAALKMLKARATGHEGWRRVLPPLVELPRDLDTQVLERLRRLPQAVALL